MEASDEALWKGWFRRVSQGHEFVTRDALVQAAEESAADFDSRPVVRDVICNIWQHGGSLSLGSFLAAWPTLLSMGLVSLRQQPESPAQQNGADSPGSAVEEAGAGGPEEDDSLLLQLMGMGFTEDQAQRGATCGSLQAALEMLCEGSARGPADGRHCDPCEPSMDTPEGLCKRLTTSFGFTQEEADLCLEDIPKLRRHNDPIAWCMDWKEGCLPSLQCHSATADSCAICYADRGSFLMVCTNKCRVCKDCMVECLKTRVGEHKVRPEDMQCPSGDGGGELPSDCVKAALQDRDSELYDKFLALAARKEVETEGESVFCPACSWFALIENAQQKRNVRCANRDCPLRKPESGRDGHFCGLCGEKPHIKQPDQDLTCEEYARAKAGERMDEITFRRMMREAKLQTCPKCGVACELESGCKYVQCICKTHFCHHCGRGLPDPKQHYSHWSDGNPYGSKCFGGKRDKSGLRALHAPCDDCLGWSYGRSKCKCRYWQTGGEPPPGAEEDDAALVSEPEEPRPKRQRREAPVRVPKPPKPKPALKPPKPKPAARKQPAKKRRGR
eukprot:Hpha_TRINITY_DN14460_c1_g1::TRINITY_DN14460_c1_g1_i1::g.158004::m.158004